MNSFSVNRIAFINTRGQLCTIAPDGDDVRVLTDDDRFFQFPAWSPDSHRLAAIGGDRRSAGVVVAEDWDGAARMIYHGEDGPPIYLYWAPRGNEVSFIAAEGYQFGLHFIQPDGERRIRAHGQPFFWRFSTAGDTFLAHTNGFGARGDLRMINTGGTERGERIGAPGRFQAPDLSINGDFAFATAGEQGDSQIVVARRDGVVVRRLDHNGVVALGWHPRQPLLAFIHPTEQAANWYGPLQLLNAATGDVRVLVEDEVLAFFWSPDGSAIAYLTIGPPPKPSQRELGSYSRIESQRQQVARTTPEVTLSIGMVELASGEAKRLARFEPQPLFINQFLPFFDQYSRSHSIWSPDSRAVVLPVMARGITPQIAVIPRDGSRAQILADGAMPFWSNR